MNSLTPPTPAADWLTNPQLRAVAAAEAAYARRAYEADLAAEQAAAAPASAPRRVPESALSARDQATAAGFGFHKHEGAFGWFGVGCPHHPSTGGGGSPSPAPLEAPPSGLTRSGQRRDSQRKRAYEFERNSRYMAGGSAFTRPAHHCGNDHVGVGQRSFRFNNPDLMSWAECEDLSARVANRFRVPQIRFLDGGNTRHSASFRWERTSTMPHDWPQMTHANGVTYTVCIKLPKWARNPWALLHEIAHYLTYCYFAPTVAGHGPEFLGVFMRLLDEFGPADFNRTEAELDATRRGLKFVPQERVDGRLDTGAEAGLSRAVDPVARDRRRQEAIEANYERKQAEKEAYKAEVNEYWNKHLADRKREQDRRRAEQDTDARQCPARCEGDYRRHLNGCVSPAEREDHLARLAAHRQDTDAALVASAPMGRAGIGGGGIDLSGLKEAWQPTEPGDWWGRFQKAQGSPDGGNGPVEGEALLAMIPPRAAALTTGPDTPPHDSGQDYPTPPPDEDLAGWPCEFCGAYDTCMTSCPHPCVPLYPDPEEAAPTPEPGRLASSSPGPDCRGAGNGNLGAQWSEEKPACTDEPWGCPGCAASWNRQWDRQHEGPADGGDAIECGPDTIDRFRFDEHLDETPGPDRRPLLAAASRRVLDDEADRDWTAPAGERELSERATRPAPAAPPPVEAPPEVEAEWLRCGRGGGWRLRLTFTGRPQVGRGETLKVDIPKRGNQPAGRQRVRLTSKPFTHPRSELPTAFAQPVGK